MTTREEYDINEDSYAPYTTTLTSDGETPITLASVDSIEMTLVNTSETVLATSIVNGRQKQNVLNTNDCTFHATSGLFTWDIQPEDIAIVGSTPIGKIERHLATFTITWDTTKKMHFEVELHILNLRNVPQVSA
jgi:hypothetical protein